MRTTTDSLHLLRRLVLSNALIGLIPPAVYWWMRPSIPWSSLMLNAAASQVFAQCIGSLAHVSMTWAYPRVAHWSALLRWPTVFVILLADTALGCALGLAILTALGLRSFENLWNYYAVAFRIGFVVSIVFGVTGAIIETMKAKLEWATKQREKALQLATEARLSSLESRIHPHFLFNALNSISSLVREDPERAERLIERMSALLRFSLDADQLGLVTLSQELENVRGYLEIEKARFGDRLQFTIQEPGEADDLRVPVLSIQSLVENSVKHVVAKSRAGGRIDISAQRSAGELEIRVEDNGPGVDLRTIPPGHGLDLLQSRLQTIYPRGASLQTENSTVILTVPCSVPSSSMTKS